jgi:hypothetical protein
MWSVDSDEQLLGEDIKAEHLNDDTLGRYMLILDDVVRDVGLAQESQLNCIKYV